MTAKTVLVTGGAGFIGSHFLGMLSGRGFKIIVVDKLTYAGNRDNLWNIDHTFYEIGIEDPGISEIIQEHQPDYVVNFAAETHVDRSIRDPSSFIKTDALGTFNLVYACLKYGKGLKRFIHISTDEVYGPCECGYDNPFFDDAKLNPTSPYSASKAAADLLLQSYMRTYGLPLVIVRPCNNYGPCQYPEKLVPMAITRLLSYKKIPLHGEGLEVREWIPVQMCAKMIYKIMRGGRSGEIFNLGTGYRVENREVVFTIVELIRGGDVDWRDCVEFIPNRPGNDARYAIEPYNYEQRFGHTKPFTHAMFRRYMRDTIDWYCANMAFWKSIDIAANSYDGKEYLR